MSPSLRSSMRRCRDDDGKVTRHAQKAHRGASDDDGRTVTIATRVRTRSRGACHNLRASRQRARDVSNEGANSAVAISRKLLPNPDADGVTAVLNIGCGLAKNTPPRGDVSKASHCVSRQLVITRTSSCTPTFNSVGLVCFGLRNDGGRRRRDAEEGRLLLQVAEEEGGHDGDGQALVHRRRVLPLLPAVRGRAGCGGVPRAVVGRRVAAAVRRRLPRQPVRRRRVRQRDEGLLPADRQGPRRAARARVRRRVLEAQVLRAVRERVPRVVRHRGPRLRPRLRLRPGERDDEAPRRRHAGEVDLGDADDRRDEPLPAARHVVGVEPHAVRLPEVHRHRRRRRPRGLPRGDVRRDLRARRVGDVSGRPRSSRPRARRAASSSRRRAR